MENFMQSDSSWRKQRRSSSDPNRDLFQSAAELNRTNYDCVQTENFSKFVSSQFESITSLVLASLDFSLAARKHKQLAANRELFDDPDFEAGSVQTRGAAQSAEIDEVWPSIEWARVSDIMGNDDFLVFNYISPNEIRQGVLSSSYLLCAFSILAEQRELISRLFSSSEPNEFGVYSIWLFINGAWQETLIDDYLPIINYPEGIELGCSRASQDEIWVSLLEKAYAKAYGGYSNIQEGNTISSLRDLTGAPMIRIDCSAPLDSLWEQLGEHFEKGFVMCGTVSAGVNFSGVYEGLTYSLIGWGVVQDQQGQQVRLLKIRIPWGGEWTGRWKAKDPNWTLDNYEAMDYYPAKDGCCCVMLEDYVEMFDAVYCFAVDKSTVPGSLQIARAASEKQKTSLIIEAASEQDCFLTMDQIDQRFCQQKTSYSPCRVMVLRVLGQAFSLEAVLTDATRNLCLFTKLRAGRYICLIETYWANPEHQSFVCGCYSFDSLSISKSNFEAEEFDMIQQKAIRSMAVSNLRFFQQISSHPLKQKDFGAVISQYIARDDKNGIVVLALKNDKGNADFVWQFRLLNIAGLEVLAGKVSRDQCRVTVLKNTTEILILKFDPRGINVNSNIEQQIANLQITNLKDSISDFDAFANTDKTQKTQAWQKSSRRAAPQDTERETDCSACTLI